MLCCAQAVLCCAVLSCAALLRRAVLGTVLYCVVCADAVLLCCAFFAVRDALTARAVCCTALCLCCALLCFIYYMLCFDSVRRYSADGRAGRVRSRRGQLCGASPRQPAPSSQGDSSKTAWSQSRSLPQRPRKRRECGSVQQHSVRCSGSRAIYPLSALPHSGYSSLPQAMPRTVPLAMQYEEARPPAVDRVRRREGEGEAVWCLPLLLRPPLSFFPSPFTFL